MQTSHAKATESYSMSQIDYSKPQIIIENDPNGYHKVTFCGATANFARISSPEIVLDANKNPEMGADGNPKLQWGVVLSYSPDTPGLKDLEEMCFGVLRDMFGGEGNCPVKYGDEEYAASRKKYRAMSEEDAEKKWGWKRGKVLIKVATKKRPFIHNAVDSSDTVVAKATLCAYPKKGEDPKKAKNKGVSAFLDEIGTVKRGPGFGGGAGGGVPRASLDISQIMADSAPAASQPSTTAPAAAGTDGMPWED